MPKYCRAKVRYVDGFGVRKPFILVTLACTPQQAASTYTHTYTHTHVGD